MSTTQTTTSPDEDFAADLRLVVPGRSCPGGAGWEWIAQGWKLFTRAPLMWIVSIVIVFVLAIVVGLIPVIGSLVFQIFQAVISGGFVIACRSLEKGDEFELEHLFAGFKRNFKGLVLVGVFLLLGWILIFLACAAVVGFSLLGGILAGGTLDIAPILLASGMSMVLGLMIMSLLAIPLMAAYWFAPALVVMHGMAPLEAMKASFLACFRNIVPFLVYSVMMFIFGFIAILPIGLGMLVWIPLAIASTYVAYRQIFTEDEARPIPVPVPFPTPG